MGLVWRHVVGIEVRARHLLFDPMLPAALDGLRAQVLLLGHELHIDYRIAAAGGPVTALRLNGRALPFSRAANPYRDGAAVVQRAAFQRACRAGANELLLQLG